MVLRISDWSTLAGDLLGHYDWSQCGDFASCQRRSVSALRDHSIRLRTIVGTGTGVALLVAPGRLRWSRRSRRVMALGAAGLIGVPVIRRLCGWGLGVERASAALIGLTLGCAQYLLSEEESSVRGAIATIGGLLVAFGLIAPDVPTSGGHDA